MCLITIGIPLLIIACVAYMDSLYSTIQVYESDQVDSDGKVAHIQRQAIVVRTSRIDTVYVNNVSLSQIMIHDCESRSGKEVIG
jgi:hypothetical protein